MIGTIRSFDAKMRDEIHTRISRTAESIATSGGATADVDDHHRLSDHVQRSRADRADALPIAAQRRRRRERRGS